MKNKKDWTRRGPRSKFITASVSPKEWEAAHIVSVAMGETVSGMLRRLISDQHYLLQHGEVYKSPIVASLDLSSEV